MNKLTHRVLEKIAAYENIEGPYALPPPYLQRGANQRADNFMTQNAHKPNTYTGETKHIYDTFDKRQGRYDMSQEAWKTPANANQPNMNYRYNSVKHSPQPYRPGPPLRP